MAPEPQASPPSSPPDKYHLLHAGLNDDGRRLDNLLKAVLVRLSSGEIQKALRRGDIRVRGAKAAFDLRIREGDEIAVYRPLWERGRIEPAQTTPDAPSAGSPALCAERDLERLTVFRNQDLWALNKPKGLAVHGPESLDLAVKAASVLPQGLSFRPGPLHRLDQQTTGLLWFSASLKGARTFSAWLREGRLTKLYLTVLCGAPDRPLDLEDRLARDGERRLSTVSGFGGRTARTRLVPLRSAGGLTLALCELETGRTHQIRAQAAAAGYALWGDVKYGGRERPNGFLLHAWKMEFPSNEWDLTIVRAPLPPEFARELTRLWNLGESDLERFGLSH